MTAPIKSEMHKGWIIDLDPSNSHAYAIYKRGPDGKLWSHKVVPGDDGPIIVAEPSLAFDPPANLRYVDAKDNEIKPDQKIAGIICIDGPRFKLEEAKRQGVVISVNEDGSLQIDQDKWWIASLFVKDKDWFVGYEAICLREKPDDYESDYVDILDIGDVIDKIVVGRRETDELFDKLLKTFKR